MKTKYFALFVLGLTIAGSLSARNKDTNKSGTTNPNLTRVAGCTAASGRDTLQTNNMSILLQTGGDMWWNLQQTPHFVVPKGSKKNSMFAGSLWLGGQDVAGQLKVAGQEYRSNGVDFWTGPLSTVNSDISPATCAEWDHFNFNSRNEVKQFVAWDLARKKDAIEGTSTANDLFPGYVIPDHILNWPAHGRNFAPFNEDRFLAPFVDVNNDGNYDPINDGDYPGFELGDNIDCTSRSANIFGDENFWWVFNDKGNIHTETGNAAIGMEIRAQAFSFATNDEVNNMSFMNYRLINRSTFTLTETYFGIFADSDLGGAQDDYVGCDVMKGLGFCYNADENDLDFNGAKGYGINPPAIGIDFFEGPFQDNDGIDNNVGIGFNEALNGIGYGDGVVDNERYGMRRFIYFNNGGASCCSDPSSGAQYYNYLRGIWKDGSKMQYGGTGHSTASGGIPADFMFPDASDQLLYWGTNGTVVVPWTEEATNGSPANPAGDRRFLESAGPFTLTPGSVNDITIGMVWAKAKTGGRLASVELMKKADEKTQALFDACFKLIDGPDAPDILITELDKQLILVLNNNVTSNNYKDNYDESNPFIVVPTDSVDLNGDGTLDRPLTPTEADQWNRYKFQGFKVYQLANSTVSSNNLSDPTLARLISQSDIKDGISQIINYTFNDNLGITVPVEMVNGNNKGVEHVLSITQDLFASGDKALVNYKTYYFMAVAYAYNNFKKYDQNNPSPDAQLIPYLEGRKSPLGAIRAISGIPHKRTTDNGGTQIISNFGDGIEITRIEGAGNSGNDLLMTSKSVDEIMKGAPWKVANPTYVIGRAPITVKVIDPLNVIGADYTLAVNTDTLTPNDYTNDTWKMWINGGGAEDTVFSNKTIEIGFEQIAVNWGLSINVEQARAPGNLGNAPNFGLIGATITFDDPTKSWLTAVPDADGTIANWIRGGISPPTPNVAPKLDLSASYIVNGVPVDANKVFEGLLNGTVAPFRLAAFQIHGPKPVSPDDATMYQQFSSPASLYPSLAYLQSVDIVFTSDKSKWTRCPVIEEQDTISSSKGNVIKGDLRAHLSVDKQGLSKGMPGYNTAEGDLIDTLGMGWFPGYAYSLETGERLNMAFGEDSWLGGNNGNDMQWNPTSLFTDGVGGGPVSARFGGKHYVYVFRNNIVEEDVIKSGIQLFNNAADRMPAYDEGKFLREQLGKKTLDARRNVYRAGMWVTLPMLAQNQTLLSTKVTLSLRVTKPFTAYGTQTPLSINDPLNIGTRYLVQQGPIQVGSKTYSRGDVFTANSTAMTAVVTAPSGPNKGSNDTVDVVVPVVNDGAPMFTFSTKGMEPVIDTVQHDAEILDQIGVVPNPYYAYSEYDQTRNDNLVKVINLPEKATINIYTINGALIRSFKKDNSLTYLNWDLKNHIRVPVASGVYLIYVHVPGVGEKVLKWFGVIRPVDLNSF